MEDNRFDNLTRQLGATRSRRETMKLIAGALAGSAAVSRLPFSASIAWAQEACAGSGEPCEMVEGSCCAPYTCFEAICDIPRGCIGEGLPCVDDFPCCEDEGTTCIDGICAVPAEPVTPTQLPDTGSGPDTAQNSWMGAVLAGGAAVVAGKLLRDRKRVDNERPPFPKHEGVLMICGSPPRMNAGSASPLVIPTGAPHNAITRNVDSEMEGPPAAAARPAHRDGASGLRCSQQSNGRVARVALPVDSNYSVLTTDFTGARVAMP